MQLDWSVNMPSFYARYVLGACLLAVLLPVARGENGFVHTTRAITPCVIHQTALNPHIMSGKTQYNIAYEWTYKRGVQAWSMSPWATVQTMAPYGKSPLLAGGGTTASTRHPIQHASVAYVTKLRLPSVLSSIIDTDQTIRVHKDLFVVNDKVYSFVQIVDVPFIKSIKISTVMTFYGNRRMVSQHQVEYAEFPWVLQWASGVLRREIIKSLERIDALSESKYCAVGGGA